MGERRPSDQSAEGGQIWRSNTVSTTTWTVDNLQEGDARVGPRPPPYASCLPGVPTPPPRAIRTSDDYSTVSDINAPRATDAAFHEVVWTGEELCNIPKKYKQDLATRPPNSIVLDQNEFTDIPSDLLEYRNSLIYLSLCNQRPGLSVLTDHIAHFVHLVKLKLSHNNLVKVPRTIANLRELVMLDLGANQFSVFPTEILCCTKLEFLNLSYNYLEQVPENIHALKALRIVLLDNNRLKEFPEGMSRMSSLERVSIKANLIRHLPAYLYSFLGQLSEKEVEGKGGLGLDDNPLEFPPLRVCRQGTPALAAFLKDWHECYLDPANTSDDDTMKHPPSPRPRPGSPPGPHPTPLPPPAPHLSQTAGLGRNEHQAVPSPHRPAGGFNPKREIVTMAEVHAPPPYSPPQPYPRQNTPHTASLHPNPGPHAAMKQNPRPAYSHQTCARVLLNPLYNLKQCLLPALPPRQNPPPRTPPHSPRHPSDGSPRLFTNPFLDELSEHVCDVSVSLLGSLQFRPPPSITVAELKSGDERHTRQLLRFWRDSNTRGEGGMAADLVRALWMVNRGAAAELVLTRAQDCGVDIDSLYDNAGT